jgi:hypothetical protein
MRTWDRWCGALVGAVALALVAGVGCKKETPAAPQAEEAAKMAAQAAEQAAKAGEEAAKAGAEAVKAAGEAGKVAGEAEKAAGEAGTAAEAAPTPAPAPSPTPAAGGTVALGEMGDFLVAIEKRVDAVMTRPAVDKALDGLIADIGSQEQFSTAGDALLAALGQAPEIAGPGAQIVGQLGEHPAMMQMIQKMLQESPQLAQDPAALEAKMSAHVDGIFAGDAWNQGFDQAFSAFSADPAVDEAFTRLGAAVTEGIDFDKTFGRYFEERISDPRMVERIKALNGGSEPTAEQAKDLLLQHVFTEARMETFFVEFFTMPKMKAEFAGALLPVLQSQSFKQSLVTRLGRVMADPKFTGIAVNAMVTLMKGDLTAEKVAGALSPLFTLPAMKTEFVGLVDDIRKDASLREPIGKAFEAATQDPSFKDILDKAFLAGL